MLFVLEKAVAKILQFRMDNSKVLDPIWNKHHIERVEIVVKETLDVKGEGEEHQLLFIIVPMGGQHNPNRPHVTSA